MEIFYWSSFFHDFRNNICFRLDFFHHTFHHHAFCCYQVFPTGWIAGCYNKFCWPFNCYYPNILSCFSIWYDNRLLNFCLGRDWCSAAWYCSWLCHDPANIPFLMAKTHNDAYPWSFPSILFYLCCWIQNLPIPSFNQNNSAIETYIKPNLY